MVFGKKPHPQHRRVRHPTSKPSVRGCGVCSNGELFEQWHNLRRGRFPKFCDQPEQIRAVLCGKQPCGEIEGHISIGHAALAKFRAAGSPNLALSQCGPDHALQMVEMFSVERPKHLVSKICSEPKRQIEVEPAVIITERNGINRPAVNAFRLPFALGPTGRHMGETRTSRTLHPPRGKGVHPDDVTCG
jgi:hypothetical protein